MKICFKDIKERIPLKTVCERYGVKLRLVGEELIGPCPLHGGDNPTAFHLHSKKNRWTCFTKCGFGDVIDFVSKIEKIGLRQAAELLVQQFEPSSIPSVHPYLLERNFDQETLDYFEVQYQQRGPWKEMITFPLHDGKGTLLGYLGRRLTHLQWGKYKIQKGLKRSQILFNLHRVHLSHSLFIVEGPFDAMRLHQAGYSNVVSLLGRYLSDYQYAILKNSSCILLLDQDDAGIQASKQIRRKLKNAKSVALPAKDPGEMSIKEIQEILSAVTC